MSLGKDLAVSLGLNLEDVDLEEIDGEILKATQAWERLLPEIERGNFHALLMQELGAGTNDDLAAELAKLPKGDLQAFVRAYIAWLFQEDADAGEYVDGDGEAEGDSAVGTDSQGPGQAGGWTKVNWAVQPVAKPVDGITWQCATCRIVNDWKLVKCQGCDANAPHSAPITSSAAGGSSSVFSFGTPAAAGAGSITSGGFTFASATAPSSTSSLPPGGSITSGGFTFAAPPAK